MKKKMSQSKMVNIIGGLSMVLVLLFCVAMVAITVANGKLNKAYEDMYYLTIYADNFGDASGYLTDEVRSYAASGNISHYDNYWYEVTTAKNCENNIAAAKEIGLTDREIQILDEISSISNNLIPLEEEAMA